MRPLDLQASFETLMSDPRLVELCELHRTGESVFDVVDLFEEQHSRMLAWMLDPKEGHGQGDEILRDLLLAAAKAATTDVRRLHENTASSRFFETWTPGVIRTSSFGAAFSSRELAITTTERVDLFVVDHQNNFIIVIENKAGSRHTKKQLDRYTAQTARALADNSRLSGMDKVFLALDVDFDPFVEDGRAADTHWVHLGYDWLTAAAKRAQMQIERGNASARLLATYCQRMTDWELPATARMNDLAAQLHRDFPDAVGTLIDLARGRPEMTWLRSKEKKREWMIFGLQYKSVVQTLKDTAGMASVMIEVAGAIDGLPAGGVEYVRNAVHLRPRGAEELAKGDFWPIFITARYAPGQDRKFNVSLVWRGREAASDDIAHALREMLAGVDKRFRTHPRAQWRGIVMARDVTRQTLVRTIVALEAKVAAALGSWAGHPSQG